MKRISILLFQVMLVLTAYGQDGANEPLLSSGDFHFLKGLTKDVMESSRIFRIRLFRQILGVTKPEEF